MNKQVDLLVEQTESQVCRALSRLPSANLQAEEPEQRQAVEELAERLRIHFFFPQLSGEQRPLLLESAASQHREVSMRIYIHPAAKKTKLC